MRRRSDRQHVVQECEIFWSGIFRKLKSGDNQNLSQQKFVHAE